jgi:hypothetical protein
MNFWTSSHHLKIGKMTVLF